MPAEFVICSWRWRRFWLCWVAAAQDLTTADITRLQQTPTKPNRPRTLRRTDRTAARNPETG